MSSRRAMPPEYVRTWRFGGLNKLEALERRGHPCFQVLPVIP